MKDLWADRNKETGTPLSLWFARYKVARDRELLMDASNKDVVNKSLFYQLWALCKNKKLSIIDLEEQSDGPGWKARQAD